MVKRDSTLVKCGLFHHLDEQVIDEVLSKSELKKYAKGSVLIEKGSVPEALFIIRNGKVGIYNEDVLLAELSELAIMGESFLAEATATATTVALTEVEAIEI
jgi:CRP-like cAMP-binding protein